MYLRPANAIRLSTHFLIYFYMVVFPNAKINLGLRVTDRRTDGYHNILSLMVPVPWRDVLEIVPSSSGRTTLTTSGRTICCPPDKNLVMKAYRALNEITPLPPLDIYLRKIIPDGAGLGGGSSDAAFTIKCINQLLRLGYSEEQMAEISAGIGADCPFFIYNKPMIASGTGTTLSYASSFRFPEHTYILIIKPQESISTAEAYSGITPRPLGEDIIAVIGNSYRLWKDWLVNDFEESLSLSHPFISQIKNELYNAGAYFASLSGSGSAVFGLFNHDVDINSLALPENCETFKSVL